MLLSSIAASNILVFPYQLLHLNGAAVRLPVYTAVLCCLSHAPRCAAHGLYVTGSSQWRFKNKRALFISLEVTLNNIYIYTLFYGLHEYSLFLTVLSPYTS